MAEFTTTVVRFNQAVNRLEVLCGMKRVPERLMRRLTIKCKAWNMRDDGLNYRFTDQGEVDARP